MFVWQRLVATPVRSLLLRQLSSPRRVRLRTSFPPRLSFATISVPSIEMSGCRVPKLAKLLRLFLGDHLAVGKDLKKAVLVLGKKVEQLRVHERLTAEDAEEGVPMFLCVGNDLVQLIQFQFLPAACRHRPSNPGSEGCSC